MNLKKIKILLKKNKEVFLFFIIGLGFFYLFYRYTFGNATVDFSEIPAGNSGKRAYFVEMVLYKIGGITLLKIFYLTWGIILVLAGILNLRNENNQYFVFNKLKKYIKTLFKIN